MNGNNNRNNNDEKMNSSLSSSVKERKMEHEGSQLQTARAKTASMPSRMDPNGRSSSHGKNSNGRSDQSNKEKLPVGKNLNPKGPTGPSGAKNNISNKGQALKSKVASAGLQAVGVPKAVSDGIVNSKIGKKIIEKAQDPATAALKGIKNAGKSEAEKDVAEKEEEEKEKEKRNGFISLRVPLEVKLIFFLAILPSFVFIILFISIIVAYAADENGFNIFLGKLSSDEDIREISKMHDEFYGKGAYDGTWNSYSTYDGFHSRSEEIGEIFEHFSCESAEECLNRDEVKFYIKVYDLSLRYKKKYNITLDWELLMSTTLSMNLDVKDVFVQFLNYYNYDDVENIDTLMNLDWDYDYKKIPGYSYLNPNDYRYDLQILAKNMVTKTTTQTCSKTGGSGTSAEITKTQTDTDIEEQYFKSGEQYYLKCAAGETYSISSNYRLDLEKFDEFLLEYIEHKIYLPAGEEYSGNYNNGVIDTPFTEGNSLSEVMINLALSKKGVTGAPNEFTNWLGPIGGSYDYAWCATFVSWVIHHTNYNGKNLTDVIGNYTSAGVSRWAKYFKDTDNLQFQLSKYWGGNYTPKQGDLIMFTWSYEEPQFSPTAFFAQGDGEIFTGFSHIGIVTRTEGDTVYTIEGNTSNMVAERSYPIGSRDISGYGVWY